MIKKEWNQELKNAYNKLSIFRGRPYDGNETTNIDLEYLGKSLVGVNFIGVFAQDNVNWSKVGKYTKCYFIINTDIKQNGGEHWLAVVKSNNNIYIHDTFGRYATSLIPIFTKQAVKKRYKVKNTDNSDKEQKITQNDCGARAIASLVIARRRGIRAYLSL